MPIVLTPWTPSGSAVYELTAPVTRVEGIPNRPKPRAFAVRQGQTAALDWTLLTEDGDPINLDTYLPDSTGYLVARVQEALTDGSPTTLTASALDAALGQIQLTLPAAVVAYPGVSRVEVGVLNGAGELIFSNRFALLVERGLFGAATDRGPPTLDEIRLRLRDSSAVDNYLLASTEFDLAEICDAIVHAVEGWNTARPPTKRYNTANFPHRNLLFMGLAAQLHYTASRHYLREHVQYSAENTSFDDKRKWQEYQQAGDRLWGEYLKLVKAIKVGRNLEAAFISRSDYPY